MSILDLRGPEFLQTYVTLLAGAVIAGLVLRRLMRGPFDEHPSWTPKLGALQVAYLADGPGGACGAAIAGLAHRNVIRAGGSPARLALRAVRPNDLTPLEDAIYTAAGVVGGANVRDVRRAALPHAKSLADELERLEFIMPLGRRLFVRFAPAALMLALLVLGIAKVAVGISRGRPIEILVFLCGAALAGFIAFLCTSNHRTVRGERFLRSLRDDNAALESTATAAPERLHYADLALAFALFGPAVLATGELSELRAAMRPPSSGGSGCGSSCGGGSSSCGGGGCGGGCGGCGGD